jgi:hypothetical protein
VLSGEKLGILYACIIACWRGVVKGLRKYLLRTPELVLEQKIKIEKKKQLVFLVEP